MSVSPAAATASSTFISAPNLLTHWQGHRRLSRRVIEAFPEDKLFTYSIGGMRPFGKLALEFLGMAEPMVRGVVTSEWKAYEAAAAPSKADILRMWDETTAELDR